MNPEQEPVTPEQIAAREAFAAMLKAHTEGQDSSEDAGPEGPEE